MESQGNPWHLARKPMDLKKQINRLCYRKLWVFKGKPLELARNPIDFDKKFNGFPFQFQWMDFLQNQKGFPKFDGFPFESIIFLPNLIDFM